MAHTVSTVDSLWRAFRALSPESRDRFLERIAADRALRAQLEDLLDLELARERAHESTRPLDDVLAEIEQ